MKAKSIFNGALITLTGLFAGLSWGQLHLNPPLGVTTSAKPMVLLVASKDHKLFYEAYNDASDINGDGILDIRFNPNITYYGLFDPSLCYTHNNAADNTGLFSPHSVATNGKCPGLWSGNWLNYVTTSRIDALRKVLYGGHREVDTTTQTILRRAYIPQDAHSWAKEYTSIAVDGYDIRDYTPLALPTPAGRRHFFGNLTANAGVNCATLNDCSSLPPLLSVVANSTKRVWEWASKERPVLDGTHGGTRTDRTVRVLVCTPTHNSGCKLYPNGQYKPIGLLHDYGENEAMLFGLLTGSYDQNTAGGVLRKVVSSFRNEVDQNTGIFTASNVIVRNFDRLRIRGFNDGRTDNAYRNGWVTTRPMNAGEFVDWGNPVAEMMYEGMRYFAGRASATGVFTTATAVDNHVGLDRATWDNPYNNASAANAPWCAKSNMLVMSDINPSFDSDQVPGTSFGNFSGDLTGLNVTTLANTITSQEGGIAGLRFIGQSGAVFDGAPTAKNVTSLGNVRGLAPEEPTKQGSYYSASVAHFGKTTDLNPATGRQTVDTFVVALASPLPRIEFPTPNGGRVTLVPFAKSVGGASISALPTAFQPTNQIVDFYVDRIVNMPGAPSDATVNGGRPSARFRINYEDVEQGADHDMDAIVEYTIELNAAGQVVVSLNSTYAAGSIIQHMGYVISGTTADGVYLDVRDLDTAAASDVDYFLDTPNTAGVALPLTMTRTFTPGGTAATLLKDPLWYAAKYGGFIDKNNNDRPDMNYEWDADGNGVPDTYFLVQNPLRLKEQLRRALDDILERFSSASNITSNSTSITTDSRLFQSVFNSGSWSGDVKAYPITSSGIGTTPIWSASQFIPLPANRKIFTRSGGNAVEFLWTNLSAADQAALISGTVLDYLRGDRSQEMSNGGALRNRTSIMGDIIHSSPFYEKDTNSLYVGANDGKLHALDAATGVELFAFIPSVLMPRLKDLASPAYAHQYYVDGEVAVSSRAQTSGINYLVATLGHGGKGLFGLNVTTPQNFAPSHVLWECFHGAGAGTVAACRTDNDLGYMLGRPVIAKMNNGQWVAIVGNGYESVSGKAALYVFDLASGTVLRKIDTGVAGTNGLAAPGVVDADGDGDIDIIYAGDLKGNVWKFDVGSASPAAWTVALSGAPLFVARDAVNNPQPITAQMTPVLNDVAGTETVGKRFVFFGTGSYFRTTDPANTQLQTWYGLIDDSATIANRSDLRERGIAVTGVFDGMDVRVFQAAVAGDMTGKKGWYIDFNVPPNSRERIVTTSRYYRLSQPVLIASSIIPILDPCVPGGEGYVNAIDPFTGGRLTGGFFDINKDGNFSNDLISGGFIGSYKPPIGMPSEPIKVGKWIVVGGTGGGGGGGGGGVFGMATPKFGGRVAWREIVRE